MPRVILALTLCSLALYGPTAAQAGAKAEGGEMSRCLDTSTKLEAGGDVSDKELAEAQHACASVKQSIKGHRDDRQGHRGRLEPHGRSGAAQVGALSEVPGSTATLDRPRSEPIGRIPPYVVGRAMTDPPLDRKPAAQGQLDATDRRRGVIMAFARHDNRSRLTGVLLEPLWPRAAHIVQLGPIAI